MEIFSKALKENDLNERLSFPTKSLGKLAQRFQGRHAHLPVRDRSNRLWKFRCTVRNRKNKLGHKGKDYLKPVLAGDWHNFAVTKDLKFGDLIKLFEEVDQATGQVLHYRVEVKKKINLRLFGVTIHESVLVL